MTKVYKVLICIVEEGVDEEAIKDKSVKWVSTERLSVVRAVHFYEEAQDINFPTTDVVDE